MDSSLAQKRSGFVGLGADEWDRWVRPHSGPHWFVGFEVFLVVSFVFFPLSYLVSESGWSLEFDFGSNWYAVGVSFFIATIENVIIELF